MSKILYLSHGGGPLPLLNPNSHDKMIRYYKDFAQNYKPKAIIVFSAHMERDNFTMLNNQEGKLNFDYYGFPDESYKYSYNPPKDYELEEKIQQYFKDNRLTIERSNEGFDHGTFVPLMIMYPNQEIPVIQISLKKGLNVEEHIDLGKVFTELLDEDILFIGSGSSFHNLRMIFDGSGDEKNSKFHDELIKVLTGDISENERAKAFVNWRNLDSADFCHPRSEHLIPLFVCYGIKQDKGTISFDDEIMGKRNICVTW